MSDTPKSTSGAKESTSKPDASKTSDSTSSSTGNSESGKSSRDSVGGASAVHYGFFSNVKSPQYRSGWDDIWAKNPTTKTKKTARAKEPVAIDLSFDELPEAVQTGLVDAARARLKKSRINYDNRARSGSVNWRIVCEVKR